MRDDGKRNVLGIMVNVIDYDAAVEKILAAAHSRQAFTVSALAVHGVMTGALDPTHCFRLNQLDLVVPDGQPVRWALNWAHGAKLRERVYGPELMLRVCERAAREQVPVFLFGGSAELLSTLQRSLRARFPQLIIAGVRPSRFRAMTSEEELNLAEEINRSGAGIVLVGLGCPRQEVSIYELREKVSLPLLAVGAAFNFHAGLLPQAPSGMQQRGLEWLFRLVMEPKRLWKRYLLLNPLFLFLLLLQLLWIRLCPDRGRPPRSQCRFG